MAEMSSFQRVGPLPFMALACLLAAIGCALAAAWTAAGVLTVLAGSLIAIAAIRTLHKLRG